MKSLNFFTDELAKTPRSNRGGADFMTLQPKADPRHLYIGYDGPDVS